MSPELGTEAAIGTYGALDLGGVARVHETTLIDRANGLSLNVVPIPRGAIPGEIPEDLEQVANALEVEILVKLPDPASSFLPHAIASLLLEETAPAAAERLGQFIGSPVDGDLGIDSDVLRFAEYCAFEPCAFLEESPAERKALAAAGTAIAVAAIPVVGVPLAILCGGGSIIVFGVGLAVSGRVGRWIDPKSA